MTRALLCLAILAVASGARGQTGDRIAATVMQIAGADAYLDVGRNDGLASGDTLRVWREGVFLGRLRVVSAASASAVVTFVSETFAVTRGEPLEIEVPTRAPEPIAEPDPAPPVQSRPSILDDPDAGARGPGYTVPVRVTGRLQIGADALQSTTTFGQTETSRQFTTPFAALRADVSGLPGGWRARLHGRGSTRMASGVGGGTDLWLYALSLTGQVAGTSVEMGRFVPRNERFTGAWDGVDLGIGSDQAGLGVVAGWRPSVAAGVPDADRPGTAVYAHMRQRRGATTLYAQASGGAIWYADALPFAGAAAGVTRTARGVRLRLSAEALADAQVGEAWEVARLAARASVSPSRALTVRAFARQYRPSVVDGVSSLLRFAPSRAVGGGATVALGPATLRGDLSLRASGSDDDWSRAVTGGASLRRLAGTPIGIDASATLWARDGRDAVFASLGASAALGAARGSLGYRLSQSPAGDETLTTHGFDAGLHAPLTARLALSLRASLASGDGLARSRIYSALWVRL